MKRGDRAWWIDIVNQSDTLLMTAATYSHLRQRGEVAEGDADSRSLTSPPVSETELRALEVRIGRPLCWSYRELLAGVGHRARLTASIGRLLPLAEVDLYSQRDADLVRVLMASWEPSSLVVERYLHYDPQTGCAPVVDYHGDHLDRVIEIAEEEDEITVLLDPLVVSPTGEWEAWYFGPGRIQGA